MPQRDDIFVKFTAQNAEFLKKMEQMEKRVKGLDDKVQKHTEGITSKFKAMGGAIGVYFGTRAVIDFGRQAIQTSIKVEGLNIALKTVFGTAEEGQRQLEFLKKETNRLGLNTLKTADSYVKLAAAAKGTNVEGKLTEELFLAVAEASSVLNLSSEDTAGAIRALEQMISKGVVSMEELRLQLGDRIPGVMKIAARAMKMGVKEFADLVATGSVMTDDFIPKFTKQLRGEFAAGVEDATGSARASFERLGNTIDEFMEEVGTPLADLLSDLITGFTDAAKAAREFGKVIANADTDLGAFGGVTSVKEEYNKEIRSIQAEISRLEEQQKVAVSERYKSSLAKQLAYNKAYLSNMTNARDGTKAPLKIAITEGKVQKSSGGGMSKEEEKAFKALQRRADIIKKDIMSAYEKYKAAVDEVNMLHEKGLLIDEEKAKAVEQLTKEYTALNDKTGELADTMQDELLSALSKPIKSFDDLKDAALDALQQIIVKAIELQFTMSKTGGAFGGGGASTGDLLTKAATGLMGFFGGGAVDPANISLGATDPSLPWLASGGDLRSGQAAVVGDGGEPELFVPSVAGAIMPFSKLGQGGGQNVVVHQAINVSTGVTQTVRAELMRAMPMMKEQAVNGVMEANNRGGMVSKSLGTRI